MHLVEKRRGINHKNNDMIKGNTPPPIFAVNYAGHISMQTGPYYGDPDILDAKDVGEDIAEANGEFIRIAYNHHHELVTRLQNLVTAIETSMSVLHCSAEVNMCVHEAAVTLKKLTT